MRRRRADTPGPARRLSSAADSAATARSIREAAAAIRGGRDFLVTSHLRPDGDNLGAVSALMLLLERLGKPFRAVNRGPMPADFAFLPGIERVEIAEHYGPSADVCVVVDTPTIDRTGFDWRTERPARIVVNIDHHPGNEMYGEVNCVDVAAPASAYLVYRIAEELGMELDRDLATAIFTGLMTDTGYFRFSNTTAETFRLAALLVARGAPHAELYRRIYEERSFESISLQGHAFTSIQRRCGNRLAWIDVTRELMARSGALESDVSSLVSKLTTIRGVSIGMTFEERSEKQTLVELRSVGDLDVGGVARIFGGGGHRNAAGCNYPGPLPEIRDLMLEAAAKLLEPPDAD